MASSAFRFDTGKVLILRRCKVSLSTVTSQHNPEFENAMKQFLKDVRLDQLLFSFEELVIGNDAVTQFIVDLEKVLRERHKIMPVGSL